jgi:hypothetical protein
VPVVLNMISTIENPETGTAMKPRPRFGMGACTRALIPAATPAMTYAVALARPRTATTAAVTLHPVLAAFSQATWSRLSGKQSAYMTLISATGDGALGPHPAREPV